MKFVSELCAFVPWLLKPIRVFDVIRGGSLFFLDDSGAALKAAPTMNPLRLLAVAILLAVTCQAQLPPNGLPQRPMPPPGMPPAMQQPVPARPAVNYVIRVEWKDARKGTNALQIVTTEGSFQLDTISGAVKINNSDVPTTVKLSGSLAELSPDKGRLQLFLGRTVPYVTSTFTGTGGGSSYSQLSVGLNSNFVVTFGKPLVIQADDNGEVTILVKRMDD